MATEGGTPAPGSEDEEERKRRRRPIAWWWWLAGGGGALVVVLALLLSIGGDDDADDPEGRVQAPTAESTAAPGGSTGGGSTADGSTATPAAEGTQPAGNAAASGEQPDIEGVWEFIVDVTEASGACAGEEDEAPEITNVTIRRSPSGTYEITGLEGEGGIPWRGGWDGDEFLIIGDRAEDGGTTEAEFALRFVDGALVGTEDWGWSDGSSSCPGGKSEVEAFFYSPLP